MEIDSTTKLQISMTALGLLPDTVRQTVYQDRKFCAEIGISTTNIISLGESGLKFDRKALFEAVRSSFQSGAEVSISDESGEEFEVSVSSDEGEDVAFAVILHSHGAKKARLIDFYPLSPNPGERLSGFLKTAEAHYFTSSFFNRWQSILEKRPLKDEEFAEFQSGTSNAQTNVYLNIKSAIQKGSTHSEELLPADDAYYENLIGEYQNGTKIAEFVSSTLKPKIAELLSWDEVRGLRLALSLGAHSVTYLQFERDHISPKTFSSIIEDLVSSGDLLSKITAAELSISMVGEHPELSDEVRRLVSSIVTHDKNAPVDHNECFSSFFIFSYAEMCRRNILSGYPVFYRRWAALAHAAMLVRIVLDCQVDPADFSKWCHEQFLGPFSLQVLVDMRAEPRWHPDLVDAKQFGQEAIGRLRIAAANHKGEIPDGELADLLLGTGEESLVGLSVGLRPYFPGPLEGALGSSNLLPDTLLKDIEEQLDSELPSAETFIGIINSVVVFEIPSSIADKAAKTLKSARYHLSRVSDSGELISILFGLARVAAVSRSTSLAQEIPILARKYRHDPQFRLPIDQSVWLILSAGAAFDDHDEWLKFVGDSLLNLSYEEMTRSQADSVFAMLSWLRDIDPFLWKTTSRADAALKSLLGVP